MNVIEIMVTIIIVTILVTVVLGVASYAAYWLRRTRGPEPRADETDGPRYFYLYEPEPGLADREEAAERARAEAAIENGRPDSDGVPASVDLVHAGSASGS